MSATCVRQWIGEHRLRVYRRDARGRHLILPADAVRPAPLKRGPRRKRDRPH